jgi:predicted  nucleic acid-binding Zn-ribbon protein
LLPIGQGSSALRGNVSNLVEHHQQTEKNLRNEIVKLEAEIADLTEQLSQHEVCHHWFFFSFSLD